MLYLLDARHEVEEQLLREWVEAQLPGNASGGAPGNTSGGAADHGPGAGTPAEMITVHLEGEIEATGLSARLNATSDDTDVVPLRVVWTPAGGTERSGPRLRDLLIGDPRRPSERLARLTLARHPERATVIAGASATVGDLRERFGRTPQQQATQHADADDTADDGSHGRNGVTAETFGGFVARMGSITLDVAERRQTGRRYKVPRAVIPGIEASVGFREAVAARAEELGKRPAEVAAEARGYLTEMVATPSTFFIDWMGASTRKITSMGYERIVTDPERIEAARAQVADHPSALLWTHKSHIDGIALLSTLYENDFPAPHAISGLNIAFAGVGTMGRRSGIIFIRRSFTDNPVYKLALRQYLAYLMEKRFPLSWAFEGTRSRTGKLMPPRYGLLKYTLDAAHATGTENLHLIPVSINYDLIGEAAEYAGEEVGRAKQSESLSWFVGYLQRLRSPLGRVYLDLADPIVLEGPAPEPTKAQVASIAFEVARRANTLVPVTLPALMCTALMGAAPGALTLSELDHTMRTLMAWLRNHDIRMAEGLDTDSDELVSLAELVFSKGIVTRHLGGDQPVFSIEESQHPVAGYYRNTIIHYFVNRAMIELALLAATEADAATDTGQVFWDELLDVRDLLKFEFFHPPTDEMDAVVDRELRDVGLAWRDRLAAGPDGARQLLEAMKPRVAHATLQPSIEAYWVVARWLADQGAEPAGERKAVVKAALGAGEQAFLRRQITTRASIGKQLFTGAHSMLGDRSLLEGAGADAGDLVRRRTELADRLGARVRRLAELRRMTLESTAPDLVGGPGTTGTAVPHRHRGS